MQPTFEKFQPIGIMTNAVLGELKRVSTIDRNEYALLYTDLVKFALLERFHFIKTPAQLEQMWKDIRSKENLLDLITRSLATFKFLVNCPKVLGEVKVDNYKEVVLPLIAESVTALSLDLTDYTAMDATLADRLATRDEFENILIANQWLVVLILLSMSTEFIVGSPSGNAK